MKTPTKDKNEMPWEYPYRKLCDVKIQLNATGKADLGFIVQSNADYLKALAKNTDHIQAQLDEFEDFLVGNMVKKPRDLMQDGWNASIRNTLTKLKEMQGE